MICFFFFIDSFLFGNKMILNKFSVNEHYVDHHKYFHLHLVQRSWFSTSDGTYKILEILWYLRMNFGRNEASVSINVQDIYKRLSKPPSIFVLLFIGYHTQQVCHSSTYVQSLCQMGCNPNTNLKNVCFKGQALMRVY